LFNRYFEVEEIMKIINATSSKDLASVADKIFDTKPTLAVVGTPKGNIDF
jgi:predicted Zn-dependent peptidase